MGQIVFNGQKPKYCNLTAITTGSKKDYLIPDGEIWLIDSTNTSKTDGTGKYDYYIKGDGSNTASQLAANKIKVDDSIDISGKADKSEMSVVAGTGANADKTTITLKSGTSATVLTQHQDVSGKEDKSNKVTSFSSPTDTQYPSAKLVNDQLATKQGTISDLSTIRSGASAGATAYQKPGTGIPKTDLASAVQTSLGKADTAIQSVTVGTTTTGAAGSSASVTNTGTATEPVLSFTIPQGAQGVKGDTVIIGGESSYTLYNTTGDNTDGAMTQAAVTAELTELGVELALGAIYDVSAHNNNATFTSLSALLSDANLSTLIPTDVRKGGMSLKFVQSSDNKYVQARCMAQNFTTDVTQWQGVDDEPTVGSDNLVKSGGVISALSKISDGTVIGENSTTASTDTTAASWKYIELNVNRNIYGFIQIVVSTAPSKDTVIAAYNGSDNLGDIGMLPAGATIVKIPVYSATNITRIRVKIDRVDNNGATWTATWISIAQGVINNSVIANQSKIAYTQNYSKFGMYADGTTVKIISSGFGVIFNKNIYYVGNTDDETIIEFPITSQGYGLFLDTSKLLLVNARNSANTVMSVEAINYTTLSNINKVLVAMRKEDTIIWIGNAEIFSNLAQDVQNTTTYLFRNIEKSVDYVQNRSQIGAYIDKNTVWITAAGFGITVGKGSSHYYIGGVTECGFELGDKQLLLIDINYLITNGTRGARNSPNDVMVLMSSLNYSNLENKNNYVIFAERQIDKTFFVGKANDMFGVQSTIQPDYETYVLRRQAPSYYFASPADSTSFSDNEYLEKKIGLVSDKSGKRFIYFADTHWEGYDWTGSQGIDYEGISTPLMLYCKNRLDIKNVIFGGDALYQDMTQKNALLLAKKFMNNVRSAFGNELLFTRGNHDLNALHGSGWHQDSLLTYDRTFPIYNKNTNVIFDSELESKINAKGYNVNKTRELVCFARGHYYNDDKENKIRYIVLDTGAQLGNTNAAWGVLGHGFPVLQLQYNFLYNALNTLPEYTVNSVTKSYDVVVSAHYFIDYRNGYLVTDPSVLQICKILSAFKSGGTIDKNSLYYDTYSSGDAPGAGDNRKELDDAPDMDFSSRSSVGKVFVVVGDSHHDTAVICQTVNNEYTSVRYNDELVQQDDAILIINTKCEVCGGTTSAPLIEGVYSYQNSAADYGTINETSFDIVTFNDEHVYCTRVGLGIDRTFNY